MNQEKDWNQYFPYRQIGIDDKEQLDINKGIKECCIAFIDILGFKNMVTTNIDKVIYALRYLKLFVDSYFRLPTYHSPQRNSYSPADYEVDDTYLDKPKATMFSDSIVISKEIDDSFNFAEFISIIAQLQFELLREGVLIRGGIDIGNVYHYESFVFGAGMISAYLLESGTARFPRITVSPNAINRVIELTDKRFENEFHQYIRVDGDKYWIPPNTIEFYYPYELEGISFDEQHVGYIDYLKMGFHMLKAPDSDVDFNITLRLIEDFELDTLSQIRELIVNGTQNSDDRVKEKYEWLKEYYNKNVLDILNTYEGRSKFDSIETENHFINEWKKKLLA